MPLLGVRAARMFGAATLLVGLAILASGLACSLIVGDSLAIVYCVPDGGAAVCGTGQICAPSLTGPEHMCTKPCTSSSQCSMGVCDHVRGWCVPETADDVMVEPADDGGTPETGSPEAPVDVAPMTDAEASLPDAPPRCSGFGCHCTKIADCDPRFVCVDKTALPEIDAGVTGGFCASPCCTSVDCEMGDGGGGASVCFATGAGGNYCVPTGLLGDRSTVGGSGGGAACMAGSDCRSGLCSDAGTCADTCCSTRPTSVSQCTNSTVCRFDPFPGSGFDIHLTGNCSVPPQFFLGQAGSMCRQNTECQSGLCITGTPFGGVCEDPCRTTSDCNSPFVRTCEYYQPDPMRADIVAVCVPNGGADAGVNVCFVDDPNSSNGDCQSGEHCRPEPNVTVGTGSYSVLACGM